METGCIYRAEPTHDGSGDPRDGGELQGAERPAAARGTMETAEFRLSCAVNASPPTDMGMFRCHTAVTQDLYHKRIIQIYLG